MKTIADFDSAIKYVSRLGFTARPGFPGWIPAAQKRMCNVADALLMAAGKQYPFTVHYHRKQTAFVVNGSEYVDVSGM